MSVVVLRLGHRISRDHRISTHCGLVSRAFGASGIVYSGEQDKDLLKSISKVSSRWGGEFFAEYDRSWKKVVNDFKGKGFLVVHLTMYGLKIEDEIRKIRKSGNVLVVAGGEKVPPEVYELADHNISVTGQPHSEIAALAVFLDRYYQGRELGLEFGGGLKVIPQKKGKRILSP